MTNTHSDTRLNSLILWLNQLPSSYQIDSASITPASSDASFRRYFRVKSANKSLIVMDAPPDKEDSTPFIRVAKLLLEAGLNVPVVLEFDLTQGFLLLSDLGNTTYLSACS